MKWLSSLLFISFVSVAAVKDHPIDASVVELQSNVQHYIHSNHGEWPKYSGALGFGYPVKTSPQAVDVGGVVYYTYTQCVEAEGMYPYSVAFVANTNGERTILGRFTYPMCDPHDNSSLYVDEDGYITVVKASRGKYRIGYTWKSTAPYDIGSFVQVKNGWWSYTKLHGSGMVYTDYNDGKRFSILSRKSDTFQIKGDWVIGASGKEEPVTYFRENMVSRSSTSAALRENWVTNEQCTKKLTNGGSYAISSEDESGNIHLLYNYHYAGNLDLRMNLYYMWSPDGCTWYNKDNEELSLPVNANSNATVIWRDYHKFTYLKDIKLIDGEVRMLVTVSDGAAPLKGDKALYLYKLDGSRVRILTMQHNYNGAKFWSGNIAVVVGGEFGYAGGDLMEYSMTADYLGTYRGLGALNYPVVAGDKLMFADTESSSSKSQGFLYIMSK